MRIDVSSLGRAEGKIRPWAMGPSDRRYRSTLAYSIRKNWGSGSCEHMRRGGWLGEEAAARLEAGHQEHEAWHVGYTEDSKAALQQRVADTKVEPGGGHLRRAELC